MADESSHVSAGPPPQYRLDAVSITLTRHSGTPSFPVRRVSLSGAGSATLERDGQSLPFRYPPKDMLALLNELHRFRFFELPADYSVRYSVLLRDDGVVQNRALRVADASSTSFCFAAGDFKKCVTYGSQGPRELEELAQRLWSEAEGLARSRPPGK
ncbi:MAG: hypothetical protein KKA55_14800 [Proteobacteria bacterium]|nr:hypothetical protein [Pseudomonadota bacterium]MBU1596789.1 hypothetical protein [Pseudomonadota bacterium]